MILGYIPTLWNSDPNGFLRAVLRIRKLIPVQSHLGLGDGEARKVENYIALI